MNRIFLDNLGFLKSEDCFEFRQSVYSCVEIIEKELASSDEIDSHVKEVMDNVNLLGSESRLAFIWLLSKVKFPFAKEALRSIYIFVIADGSVQEMRQWLICYEDLMGHLVAKQDKEKFERLLLIAGDNQRLVKVLSRFKLT